MADERGPAGAAEVDPIARRGFDPSAGYYQASGLGYRPLRLTDARFCWRLASDPEVRAVSVDRAMPKFWGHAKWMCVQVLYWNRAAYVIRRNWRSIGLVRATALPGGGSEVSIALLGAERGQGTGTKALRRMTP